MLGSIFDIIFSISLLRHDRSEIGRYEEGRVGSFRGFNFGMMIAFFHESGI